MRRNEKVLKNCQMQNLTKERKKTIGFRQNSRSEKYVCSGRVPANLRSAGGKINESRWN